MIHFDTNFLIQAAVAGLPANEKIRRWASAGEVFGISSIAWSEYLCGPLDDTAQMLARQIFPAPNHFLQWTARWPQNFSMRAVAAQEVWPTA